MCTSKWVILPPALFDPVVVSHEPLGCRTGRLPQAIEAFHVAIGQNATNTNARVGLGEALIAAVSVVPLGMGCTTADEQGGTDCRCGPPL
jgi:hypothetical protein